MVFLTFGVLWVIFAFVAVTCQASAARRHEAGWFRLAPGDETGDPRQGAGTKT